MVFQPVAENVCAVEGSWRSAAVVSENSDAFCALQSDFRLVRQAVVPRCQVITQSVPSWMGVGGHFWRQCPRGGLLITARLSCSDLIIRLTSCLVNASSILMRS